MALKPLEGSILFEDNHLLVVEKPPNIVVQADRTGDPDLLSLLKEYIKRKYGKPGEVYLGLVHRLDRPVGGVMVFARTSKAASRLAEQLREGAFLRDYLVIVQGDAPDSRVLEDDLQKDPVTNITRVVNPGEGKPAKLAFAALARREGCSLLQVTLFTGRSHQIRVQLAHAGYPIVSDLRYNPNAKPGRAIRLYAYRLAFAHPTRHTPLTFTALPDGRDWKAFSPELLALTHTPCNL